LLHEAVKASIDCDRRFLIQQNHSATHLLQASLRKILGSHVTQQGSYVSDKGLRFDFNNFSNVDETKILEVEALVNSFIKQKNDVVVSYMNYDDAIKKGAMAIFSEKYSETVRVVDMGNSVELCGGTHVNCVCEIGSFAIGSISSIGSGIFRIEAVSGQTKSKILRFLRPLKKEIKNILNLILQLDPSYRFKYPKVVGSYQDILNLRTSLEELRRVKQIKDRDLKLKIRDNFLATLNNLTFPANQDFYIYESKDISLENLREGINLLWTKTKAKNLVCFNVSEKDISFLVRSETQQASAIISEINLKFASKGGGSKTLAQGGTPNIALAADILKYFKELLK
jgi:alanyl-tRNA synthetase